MNYQKTPPVKALSQFVANRTADALTNQGKSLPVEVVSVQQATSGSGIVPIVTVQFLINQPGVTFPQVTCGVANSKYARDPIQVGDQGYVVPSDAYMGEVTGLGGGVATLTAPGNLSALVFHPVGNASWTGTNANQYDLQGPQGVNIHDVENHAVINVGTSAITLSVGSNGIIINSGGITINGTLNVDGGPIINNGTTVIVP